MQRSVLAGLVVLVLWPGWFPRVNRYASADRELAPAYLFPADGAQEVIPGARLLLRPGGEVDPKSISPKLFTVTGSQTGLHPGQVVLSDDRTTVSFVPAEPFGLGERVKVYLRPGLRTRQNQVLGGLTWGFDVRPEMVTAPSWLGELAEPAPGVSATMPAALVPDPFAAVTFPASFPVYTVTVSSTVPVTTPDPAYVFFAPNYTGAQGASFLSIFDLAGEPIFYQALPANTRAYDFKQQPTGTLTYISAQDYVFHELDTTYTEVDTHAAIGYPTDVHELLLLPNGHALLMIYDTLLNQDLSAYGGHITATVVSLVIQELDANKNLFFEWHSWGQLPITETQVSLTTPVVDYAHGNAIEVDLDGHLLISSRNLSEITKIDRVTGDIIWRLGGHGSDFTFPNGEQDRFAFQHDVRRLPNGNLTLFDNHVGQVPPHSRAVEYVLDEVNWEATVVWEYHHVPEVSANAQGSARRQADGSTIIGWGSGLSPAITVIDVGSETTFELELAATHRNYRALLSAWHAVPAWEPVLAVTAATTTSLTLAMSWNGATDIAAYRVYGGRGPEASTLLATVPRTGFADEVSLHQQPNQHCYWRVLPITQSGEATRYSNEVSTGVACRAYAFLPILTVP